MGGGTVSLPLPQRLCPPAEVVAPFKAAGLHRFFLLPVLGNLFLRKPFRGRGEPSPGSCIIPCGSLVNLFVNAFSSHHPNLTVPCILWGRCHPSLKAVLGMHPCKMCLTNGTSDALCLGITSLNHSLHEFLQAQWKGKENPFLLWLPLNSGIH